MQDKTVDLCVGLVDDVSPNGKKYVGTASGYLASRDPEDSSRSSVYVAIEVEESFRLPSDNQIPVILISAGTGFAPMRSFIQGLFLSSSSLDLFS